ncbi:dihydrolipoyl dehydrogenase [Enemella sp. A6]|uniref:dihydrolipoyl dehydrogenase n=1 Tax=Enemella sp. A6 TaxID=3440152 RepID=UPI003EB8B167
MTHDATDLVVLGAGSGGYAAALRAAQLGLSVTLIERDLVGGTCLHRGCVPTKAMLHAGDLADAARTAGEWGVACQVTEIDAGTLLARTDQLVHRLHTGLGGLIDKAGITVVRGEGELIADGPGVRVGDRVLRADTVVLATGARPRQLPGVELDGERIVTSDQALRLNRIPQRVAVIGGGVIGVEFASLWASLGAEVHLVEAADRLLLAEDDDIAAAFTRAFTRRGIRVRTGVSISQVRREDDLVRIELADDTLEVDAVLVAVGREPVTDAFAGAGVDVTETGHVRVDEHLSTSVPGVFAVGDLIAGPQLAHRGFAHGIFVAERAAHASGRLDRRPVLMADHELPRITYSEPQVASVGLGEQAARDRHGAIEVRTADLAGNARAQLSGGRGMVKLIRAADGPVVGISAVGPGVGELMGEGQLIVGWGAHPEEVAALVHAHPTLGEALGEAHLALAGTPLHLP